MEELRELHSNLLLPIWQHMKNTVSCVTNEEWEACFEEEKKILEAIGDDKDMHKLAVCWLAAWESYLEERGKQRHGEV